MNQNLCNNSNICNGNLDIPRYKMPQIEDKYLNQYLNIMKKKHKVIKSKYLVRKIKPTQNELSRKAIKRKQKKIRKGTISTSPIIISNDYYILDGHHRWGSLRDCENLKDHCNIKQKIKISAYKIDLPIKKLINKTKKLNFIKYERMH